MKPIQIFFFKEGIKLRLSEKNELRNRILKLIKAEGFDLLNINFIFCTDNYLRKINKEYLGHDYFTDVITFDYSIIKKIVTGDIYISIDRVRINSVSYDTSLTEELQRVMVHGVLHLLGYDDKNKSQKFEMKKMEDRFLLKKVLK